MIFLRFFCCCLLLLPTILLAQIKIDIQQGNIKVTNFLIYSAFADNAANLLTAEEINQVIANNLKNSGLFNVSNANQNDFDINDFTARPPFAKLRNSDQQFLLLLQIKKINNQLIAEMRLWDLIKKIDVFSPAKGKNEQLAKKPKSLSLPANEWRRLAHQLSDEIYIRLTGETAYFDSQIVFIAESGDKRKKIKKLAIIDQDGANFKTLTNGASLVLTPRFSHNQHKISYLSYRDGKPEIFIYDLANNSNKKIGQFMGMSFAPRFSPDDKKLIFSYEQNGVSNIYQKDLETNAIPIPLTKTNDINTSPSYSPDGNFIVFTSDRGGSPQLYIMDKTGKNIRRISYGDGEYSTPVWSPRGDYIAFTKQYKNVFYIGLVKPDGTGERLLSQSFLDEGPTWSPNGRVLAFFRQATANDEKLKLWTVDVTGFNLRPFPYDGEGSDPAWSPLKTQP